MAIAREDERHMRRALRLAERGRGRVRPNPVVGAVLVRGGRVVGDGWHAAIGRAHAEVMALERAGARARGATLYVTLEPCAHTGRTPPCVDAIIAAGIRRCVVALRDPHRIVNGRGLRRLRRAGIRVDVGCLAEEARAQLAGYLLAHTTGRPRVTLKLAASLDGRIAPAGGFARRGVGRWLTGAPARAEGHRLRAASDAVVIGAGTARSDDPRLTARGVKAGGQPVRVVCDTRLALPRSLALFRPALAPGTVVAYAAAPGTRVRALESRGVRAWRLPRGRGGVSLAALARRLVRDGCYEVLVEGGAKMATGWLAAGLVDRIALFTAPEVLSAGGLAWSGPAGSGPRPGARGWRGRVVSSRRLGHDVLTWFERTR